jgi:uncharacterized protein (TIGR03000 family)
MNPQRLSTWVYSAMATAALAFACGPAWAQKGHGGGHGGGGGHHEGGEHHGGGEHWNGGGNHWGGYYGGYGYGGYGYYPWGLGRALFGGGYGYPYGGYNGGYYNNYPYYDNGYYSTPNYSVPSYSAPTVNAPAASANIPDNAALINVRVPSNAQVWIDDQKTKQSGSMREFVTPALNPGQEYSYDIRASWTENGQPMETKRKVTFHAGDRLAVNMMTAQSGATYYGAKQ